MSAPYDQDDPAGDNTPPHGYKRPAVCDLCVTAPAFCLRRDGQCLRTSELGGRSHRYPDGYAPCDECLVYHLPGGNTMCRR